MNEKQLIEAGGKLWEGYGKKRIYFNDMAPAVGLNYSTYKTGNISNASLNGETISNSKASKLLSDLNDIKFWYDCTEKIFGYKHDMRLYNADIIAQIEAYYQAAGELISA